MASPQTMTEDEARAAAVCPSCGQPKEAGILIVCWSPCYRGPNGLKYSGLSFEAWMASRPTFTSKGA